MEVDSMEDERMEGQTAGPAVKSAFEAYRAGVALVTRLPDAHAIRVTGADRLDFVHGQVSNEVRGLTVGGTSENLLLNHKGHALAHLRVVRREDDLYLSVEGNAGALVREQLERHVIFDAVEIEDLSDRIETLTLQGAEPAVQRALAALGSDVPVPGHTTSVAFQGATLLIAPAQRSGAGGVDIHVLSRQVAAVHASLTEAGAFAAEPRVLPLLRVVAGIARAASEAGEGVLPQEAGLEPLVSYRKGCYLGQEIMARIEGRGAVRKQLTGVELDELPTHREIVAEERVVGRLGTVAEHPDGGWLALAVARKDLDPDGTISYGGVSGRLASLPFAAPPE